MSPKSEKPSFIPTKLKRFYARIMELAEMKPTKRERTAFLKKITVDCKKIIELSELFDDEDIDINMLSKQKIKLDENFKILFEDLTPKMSFVKEKKSVYLTAKSIGDSDEKTIGSLDNVRHLRLLLELDIDSEESFENKTQIVKEGSGNFNKLKIKSSMSDIVRIFEAMKRAEILSSKTSVKQISDLFFNNLEDKINFEKKYGAIKSALNKYKHSSNSEQLVNFVKILCKESFDNKEIKLEEIVEYLERLQKNIG